MVRPIRQGWRVFSHQEVHRQDAQAQSRVSSSGAASERAGRIPRMSLSESPALHESLPREHIHPLTSLRFVAAALIVLTHSRTHYAFSSTWGDPLALGLAVRFFFVLSGFVLAHAYRDIDAASTPRFFAARFARLWPLHFTTFVLYLPIVYVYAAHMPSSRAVAVPANLALVHGWVPYPDSYFSFNPVSWSISTEVGLYLLFPLLMRNWPRTWLAKLLLGVLLFGAMERLAIWLRLPLFEFGMRGPEFNGLWGVHPLANVLPFVLGMASWSAWQYLQPRLRVGLIAGTIAEVAAVFLAGWTMSRPENLQSVLLTANLWPGPAVYAWVPGIQPWAVAFPVLIVTMACRRGLLSRLLSLRPFVVLGEISYAVYLVHYGIMLAFAFVRPLVPRVPDEAVYALFWLVVLAASWLLWRWVECPARSYVRAWWQRHEADLAAFGWRRVGAALAVAASLILVLQVATLPR